MLAENLVHWYPLDCYHCRLDDYYCWWTCIRSNRPIDRDSIQLMFAAAIVPTIVVVFENDCFFVAVLIHSVHNQDSFKQLITRRFGVFGIRFRHLVRVALSLSHVHYQFSHTWITWITFIALNYSVFLLLLLFILFPRSVVSYNFSCNCAISVLLFVIILAGNLCLHVERQR